MTVQNTTSLPINIESEQKGINFDNTSGTAQDLWVPVTGKRILLSDVVVSVINKQNNTYIIVAVQIYIGGGWKTLLPVAVGALSSQNFAHNFGGRIYSAKGDGTARMRVVKQGNSTNWESMIVVTGNEQ